MPSDSYKSESFKQVSKINGSYPLLGIQIVKLKFTFLWSVLRSNREVKIKQESKWLNMQKIVIHSDMAT